LRREKGGKGGRECTQPQQKEEDRS
jgi:hypothetical protein